MTWHNKPGHGAYSPEPDPLAPSPPDIPMRDDDQHFTESDLLPGQMLATWIIAAVAIGALVGIFVRGWIW